MYADGWIHEFMDGWMAGWMGGWRDGAMREIHREMERVEDCAEGHGEERSDVDTAGKQASEHADRSIDH